MNTRVLALAAAPVVALGLGCKTDGTATDPATAPRAPPAQAAGRPAPSPVVGSLTGRVAEITDYVLTIETDGGVRQTLTIDENTLVTIDGRTGRASDLQLGQQVRASYGTVNGRSSAVRIEAGSGGASSPGVPAP